MPGRVLSFLVLEQLDNLAGVGWFGEGSRVIITTQDSGLLKCHGIELIYEVQKLFDYQALELFSLNAFGIKEPSNDYLELTQRAIAYAQGLPLAITLLGSHLRNKGRHRWQAILDGYEGEPYLGIQKILRKSYDALESSMQQVFLDIACFFKGMRKLQKFKYMPKLTSLNLSGCQFLKKIPDLSGIPNIKWLNLSKCTSLVEVDDSVGLLDKLVELNLDGCFKLTRFATILRLKSLERLCLRNCGRLESFPEIEDKLESLVILNIGESGIRGFPSSVAYLTGITFMSAGYCDNLTFTSLRSMYGLQRLTTFGDKVNSDSNISLALPKLVFFNLQGCNLSESNFVLPLDCWFTFTFLDLSGNNFVRCPGRISKFANLWFLRLNGCKGLQEIPELLRPSVDRVLLPNCTSLEKFPKLPQGVRWLDLVNCHRLGGYEITENILLNKVPHFVFEIILPGNAFPKWVSCCKNATVRRYPDVEDKEEYIGGCEFSFEIPPNLEWETSRLVLCVSYHYPYLDDAKILINGKLVNEVWIGDTYATEIEDAYAWLKCVPLLDPQKLRVGEEPTHLQQGNMCQVIFHLQGAGPMPVISCGVHLLGHQVADVSWSAMDDDDDITMNESTSSVGKTPRGSDITAVDDHDHQEQSLACLQNQRITQSGGILILKRSTK
ncbi:PREDICTED: disease resistance protein TAO1-like [Prunus mume]|uniref:Disease resistance protein TAO1-like n=1 Tax=Prunus mume TaxID=102107 RepID=A0ABM1LY33_PRUMU|nr:PREDICTED: disease resistance protein TAO1-like [Prunus mume]